MQTEMEAAKQRFEECKSVLKKVGSFDYFYNAFRTLRHSEIGEICGAGRGAVSRLFTTVFKPLFVLENPKVRPVRLKTIHRYQELAKVLPEAEPAKTIAQTARSHGLDVQRIYSSFKSTPHSRYEEAKRQLLIEGKRCYLVKASHLFSAHRTRPNYYTPSSFVSKELAKYDYVIIYRDVPSLPVVIFNIPTALILEKYKGKIVSLYIPKHDDIDDPRTNPKANNFQRVYFWHYANNWYQFKPFIPASQKPGF